MKISSEKSLSKPTNERGIHRWQSAEQPRKLQRMADWAEEGGWIDQKLKEDAERRTGKTGDSWELGTYYESKRDV